MMEQYNDDEWRDGDDRVLSSEILAGGEKGFWARAFFWRPFLFGTNGSLTWIRRPPRDPIGQCFLQLSLSPHSVSRADSWPLPIITTTSKPQLKDN